MKFFRVLHPVFLVIASSIASLSSQSMALAINPQCNPIGIDLNELSQAKIGQEFTLKQGKKVEVPTIVQRGKVRSLVLSIEKLRDDPQPGKQIYQIEIYHLEEYPKCHQLHINTVLISRFADYTLNPPSISNRYKQYIGIDLIRLELIDLTASGEAKIKLIGQESPSSNNELNLVKDYSSLIRFKGQKVKLVGYYVSQTKKANPQTANNFGFTGEYRTSQIVLEDGTIVSIFPIGDKRFLRSAEEVSQYQGKIIEAVGIVDFNSEIKKNPVGYSFFIKLEKLDVSDRSP